MESEVKIDLKLLTIDNYKSLKEAMVQSYADMGGSYWSEGLIQKLIDLFPEGQLSIELNGKVVACALSIIVDYKKYGDKHRYEDITGNFTFSTHDPDGDVLYGVEVLVHPEYRGLRLGRRLYDARKALCERLNLRSIMAGGRIPNYSAYADKLSPREYIDKVKLKEIHDSTLSFQLSNDFHVKKIIKGYLPGDTSSLEYATLLEWNNIYYAEEDTSPTQNKTYVRLGLVQWQMRSLDNLEALFEQAEFFVDAVSGYQSDFLLFPELFNAPLMRDYNHLTEAEAIRQLASFTQPIFERFKQLAVSYNINIITGSMPLLQEGHLKNVGYLCRRDGTYEMYEKIHITPSEADSWGMVGGNQLRVFDTDCGKIGILICYDVEFPELPRMLAEDGMQLLFVPFLTDTQNGYTRVRNCAMARAIENECYVAIAGSVGNLPKVNNMDIQYAQSAVFTPSDFAFPNNGVKAETTPNTEMTLIVDVDLDLLKELHNKGSVRNLKDRRLDLYSILRK
ncbi:bifunctional GNAT family N-acetyltransferase/carbon-nitrogen hydrolase family protein [Cytophagales bacterium LB-30]|uniref:Bifunctional GNAT family N-acetyltransferase/carbon-nitrogen hydrolase family protein n=1 Tax=Shiella aurantiaca TaxID=3058365 RepID=A0ABT8F4Y8_9BACT|nr:bifunctional GNAT family N-acetyltransferase/carbon-nitrogen hydrolase family protein [Shiella aurantiaca]MDN4165510.1 bifunctional GNAT family N-acetyltransferase/carbon-nitrogen hydrolase family protein [Shiella aurantiaca]